MKSKLRRPFRAPREAVDRSKALKVSDQLDVATEQPPPDPLQTDSEEATELGVVWKPWVIKETQDPEVEPLQNFRDYVRLDSITETADEYEARMDSEQLADTSNGCKLTLAMVKAAGAEGAEILQGADPIAASDKGEGTTSEVASPNLSEFERYLDGCEKISTRPTQKRNSRVTKPKEKVDSDEEDDLKTFGDLLVQARSKRKSIAGGKSLGHKILLARPEDDQNSRVVDLDDIIPDARSDDDDVPIVSTLKSVKPKRKGRTKAVIKWTYETVAEPTGAASKYWDAAAPEERATKRLAKAKLVALKAAEADPKGNPKSCCQLSYLSTIPHIYCFQLHC
jgi:hypothetical protein